MKTRHCNVELGISRKEKCNMHCCVCLQVFMFIGLLWAIDMMREGGPLIQGGTSHGIEDEEGGLYYKGDLSY